MRSIIKKKIQYITYNNYTTDVNKIIATEVNKTIKYKCEQLYNIITKCYVK